MGEKKEAKVTVRLRTDDLDALQRIADREDRTTPAVVRRLVRAHLASTAAAPHATAAAGAAAVDAAP